MTASAAEGGKAFGLRRLRDAGFAVPAWIVVPADATEADLAPPLLAGALDAFLERYPGSAFAVRSSSLDEDGESHSFAGQFDTMLGVAAQDVPNAVREVRMSANGERARAYRRHSGLAEDVSIAVIVQVMVEPIVAGVAFGRDPIDGARRLVISAVRGRGERLVSGETNADTVRIEIEPRSVTRAATDDESILDEALIAAVSDAALAVERAFGAPQDLEWAWAGDTLYLLQARPITAVGDDAIVWDNSNIAESYGGVVSPLTFSFARFAYATAYRQMFRLLRVPQRRIETHGDAFEHLIGLVDGRMYYRLSNWYELLALLPGFRLNHRFMEEMMGVEEGLPAQTVAALERSSSSVRGRLSEVVAVAVTLLALLREQFVLPKRIAIFQAWFAETMRENADLRGMDVAELIAAFAHIEKRLATRWDAPLLNDFFTMIYFGILSALCRKWLADADGTVQNDLVAGTGDLASAEPAHLILLAARSIAGDVDTVRIFSTEAVDVIAPLVAERANLARYVDEYLRRFGDRCESELKLESVRLTEDPLPLFRAIGRAATSPERPSGVCRSDDIVVRSLGGWKRRSFRFVLANARDRIRDREKMRLDRTRLFGRVRGIFLALAERYVARGSLAARDDVFLLTLEEALHPQEYESSYRELTDVRRAEAQRFHSLPVPPARVHTQNGRIVDPPRPVMEMVPPMSLDAERRKGIGCCAGIVEGIVAVIHDPSMPFEAGRILVTERTDPSWVMLFPAAAGILVERGSLLSHAAIVSREMNVPSVVAIRDLMTWLVDGDRVRFDGATGVVQKLA